MELDISSIIRIDRSTTIKPFDCGNEDLNNFLMEKSKNYRNELLATTYLLENEERTIAFFSIFNDSLRVQEADFASTSAFKKLLKSFVSHPKRHLEYYPSLKIGRLAVCNRIQKSGVGKFIMDFIIYLAMEQNNSCACKFITVDAYSNALSFYERMGFKFLSEKDKDQDTRQMYLDITPFINYN